jgi:hypothetical protein
MPIKPVLPDLEIEYDARNITVADLATVTLWPDSSGNANDATLITGSPQFQQRGWVCDNQFADAVEFVISPAEVLGFDGTPFINTDMTWFFVGEITDFAVGLLFTGGTAPGNATRSMVQAFACGTNCGLDAGAVGVAMFDTDPGNPSDIISAPGLVEQGSKFILTYRTDAATLTGKILRLNGEQVAFLSDRRKLISWPGAAMNRVLSSLHGSGRVLWISGHTSALSDSEIVAMESYLAGCFPCLGASLLVGCKPPVSTTWSACDAEPGPPPVPKPEIAGLEVEFDAREIVGLSDLESIVTWPDSSGNANDATASGTPTYEATGWVENALPDVLMDKVAGNDFFAFDGSGFIGTEFCWFFVVEATSLAASVVITGGSNVGNLQCIEIAILSSGGILFSKNVSETGADVATTATGLVSEGDRVIITCRHTNAEGMIIRLNGTQVGVAAGGVNDLNGWPDPFIGNIISVAFSTEARLAWLSGYTSDVSDADILLMEEFLDSVWFA